MFVRPAAPGDRPQLLQAIIELQDYERLRHPTRLPGALVAAPYLDWLLQQTETSGAVLVAEIDGTFGGFVAGWIEETKNLGETPDSNRFGYISDICVMPHFRGHRVATQLLGAIEQHLCRAGIAVLRVNALAANESARASYERSGFTAYEVCYEKAVSGIP